MALSAFPFPVHADILKFIDENGVVHFTDRVITGKGNVFLRSRAHAPLPSTTLRDDKRRRFMPLVRSAADRHGIKAEFVEKVIEAESGFNHRAVSRAGAQGLMQLMPSTAMRFKVRDVFDPEENIEGGVRYLKELLNKYNGDKKLALAAYNAGEEAVAKYKGVPPYKETREYVKKILERFGGGSALAAADSKRFVFRYIMADGSILLTDTPRQAAELN